MADTEFDASAIHEIAGAMLASYERHSKMFLELERNGPYGYSPEAGAEGFSRAQHCEHVWDDRRNGIVADGRRMKAVLTSLRDTMVSIANELELTDEVNHDALMNIMQEKRGEMTAILEEDAEEQETREGNFMPSTGPDDPNLRDGNGYNDPDDASPVNSQPPIDDSEPPANNESDPPASNVYNPENKLDQNGNPFPDHQGGPPKYPPGAPEDYGRTVENPLYPPGDNYRYSYVPGVSEYSYFVPKP